MFHLLHDKGDNYLTKIPGCPEKKIRSRGQGYLDPNCNRMFYGRHHDLVDSYGIYVSQIICLTCRKHFLVLSSFMTYHRVCNQTNTTALVEQELLTLPEHLSSPRILVGFLLLDLQFYVHVLQIIVCPFYFFFWPLCCLFFLLPL